MTKKEYFTGIRSIVEHADASAFIFNGNTVAVDDVLGFIDKQIEVLSRKRSSSKPTKTQIANEAVKAEIADVLTASDTPMTVGEIVKALDNVYTSQKISALLRQMDGTVTKTVEKKVSRFEIA